MKKDGQTKESNLRGLLQIRVTFVVDGNPALVIVIHPTLDCAAAFRRVHRPRLADIINPNVARADDERHAEAAGREGTEPVMRDGVHDGDARRGRVERVPAVTLEERGREGVHEVIRGHAHRRDFLVLVRVQV